MKLDDLNPAKRKFVWMLKLFNTFYKKEYKLTMHETLSNTGNPLIKTLHEILMETSENMSPFLLAGNESLSTLREKDKMRYKDMILTPGEFILGIPYIDTAYEAPFTWAAYKFGKACRENPVLWEYLEKNAKEPKMWCFNCWGEFKQDTKEKIESGELIPGAKSESESLFVDDHNDLRLKEFAEKQKQIGNKHKHW